MNKANEKIDFKKCPFCGSAKVQAMDPEPTYDYEHNEYHEPCDCGDCNMEWTQIYTPSRIQSDSLDSLGSLRRSPNDGT